MKKILFMASIIAFAVWFFGTFIFVYGKGIHFFLLVAFLLYIKSLMECSDTSWRKYFQSTWMKESD